MFHFDVARHLLWGLSLALLSSVGFSEKSTPKKPPPKRVHSCYLPRNPVCQAMMKLAPRLQPAVALVYSNAFVKVARRQKIPVQLLVAIAMQESNFRLDAVRQVKGLVLEDGVYRAASVGSDFCMMQINAVNIYKLNLDANQLLGDPEYCIGAGAKVLNYFKRFAKTDPTWWTRYNAFSDLHRKVYLEHVLKHWRQIDPAVDEQLSLSPDKAQGTVTGSP